MKDKRFDDDHMHHHKGRGAKTFRRGKALAFLERLEQKRSTIQHQLEQPEYQSIQQILVGELKAIDMVTDEFKQLFKLDEIEDKKERVNHEEN
ncbi:hypothetical protein [Gracilibacillus salinarum]|uniref:2-keto-3-deoxygluconate kinase n=1 Tax=Gracilibacillus salinarum TaxID=2932255 RepID=A0ABY4GTN9_9BACI|nr:hypothetical protein [Gracilibacillus salinarum]UOQ86587.1 hypothetical protein MUN87_06785 [Gracilibacillus salinarum]